MKKTYLLGSMILSIVALVAVIVVLSVTGVLGGGDKNTLVFASESRDGVYDGAPLTEGGWQMLSGELKEGHVAEVSVFGSQTTAGTSDNSMSVRILDENKADVTSEYNIELRPGKLTVNPIYIKILSNSASKSYDGTPLSNHTYQVITGKTLSGHELEVSFSASQTSVGSCDNVVSARVKDQNGVDVSSNYKIETESGRLTVSGIVLEIATDSDTKTYDGTALVNNIYRIVSGSLRYGDDIIVTITGSQKEAGSSKNTFSVEVINAAGESVTSNYDIRKTEGTLTVKKRPVEVVTESRNESYRALHETGGVLTYPYAALYGELAKGANGVSHTYKIEVTGRVEGVGSADNTFWIEIYDENGGVVTPNYDIKETLGTLQVLPVDIVITSESASITYDEYIKSGKQPLTADGYYASVGDLLSGHDIKVTVTGEQRGVGASSNTIGYYAVVDENGIDVTDLYSVVTIEGDLIIEPIYMTFATQGGTMQYDGITTLVVDPQVNWGAIEAQLYPGHYIASFEYPDYLTEAGSIPNRVIFTIKDENGEDVTDCYFIDAQWGYLKMTQIPVFITSDGIVVDYNGEEVRHESYVQTGDAILGWHDLTVLFTARNLVDAGTYDNVMRFIVKDLSDPNERDVTHNYDFRVIYGKIVIKPITITIRTESKAAPFNNQLLTASGWEIISGTNVLDSHELNVKTGGGQFYVGESLNTLALLEVTDKVTKENVTHNYDFSKIQYGVLTVYDPSAVDPSPEIPDPFDNFPGDRVLLANVKSSVSGPAYLRFMSYGDYNGQGFEVATEYDRQIEGKYGMSYLTSFALKNADYISERMEIEYKYTLYFLPYYLDTAVADYKIQGSDIVFQDSGCIDAMMYYYTYWYNESGAPTFRLGEEFEAIELEYRKYVYDAYASFPAEYTKTLAVLNKVIADNGLDQGDKIQNVIDYLQSDEFTYDLKYNKALDSEDDMVSAFLTTYKVGVCRQFAASATLLLRAMGIPARYTGGVLAEIDEADQWTEVYSDRAHAWVEAYIDGVGWVALEVTAPVFEEGVVINPEPVPPPDDPDIDDEGPDDPFDGPRGEAGFSNIIKGPDPNAADRLLLQIKANVSTGVYLRYTSYGDYRGKSFGLAPVYEELVGDTYAASFLSSFALKNADFASNSMEIRYKISQYLLPTYMDPTSNGYTVQTNDVWYSSSNQSASMEFYNYWYSGSHNLELPSEYESFELEYRKFVYENYLDIGDEFSETEALIREIIATNGLDRGDKIANAVNYFLTNGFKYNLSYDEGLDSEDDIVYAFLTEYKEGVCAHYAAAGTLLLRAMGIPARYTVGAIASTQSDTWVDVMANTSAHAWVEAYIDGVGWVAVEMTVPGFGGGFTPPDAPDSLKPQMEISPSVLYEVANLNGEVSPTYDMATFTGNNVFKKFVEEGGQVLFCELEGGSDKYGYSSITIKEGTIVLVDKNGEPVTENYNITLKEGKMRLYASKLQIKSQSQTFKYDNTPKSWEYYDLLAGELIDTNHKIVLKYASKKTNAGVYANTFDCEIIDTSTNTPVTEWYLIEKSVGSITISPLEITLIAHSMSISVEELESEYNNYYAPGPDDFEYIGELYRSADGTQYHEFKTVEQTGSISGWSESVTSIIQKTIVIVDQDGNEVTGNYKFVCINGFIESY